ncbi:MAG TPA: glycosyltransferase [Ignavibacteriaceae bacterium]|nr:glycosyltransferase [Ignavibacteriaceae bacterium]
MFDPIKIIDINISPSADALRDLGIIGNYKLLKALVRWDNISIGFIEVPVVNQSVSKNEIIKSLAEKHSKKIESIILQKRYENIIKEKESADPVKDNPLVTVAVCTRDRAENLELCIDSLLKLRYPNLEIIVIDNAPSDYSTKNVVKQFSEKICNASGKSKTLKYFCESIPGLNWARNRAVREAEGEIIAFTDDDVVVDEYWIAEIVKLFNGSPSVMAVTGLVVPYQIENYSEFLFERYGGFGRGFERAWYRWSGIDENGKMEKAAKFFGGTGKFGTGANMAFRKKIFAVTGLFDPSLDVGTPANGGGDLEMFFRIIRSGFTLVYEPNAVVRHRHRTTYDELKTQIRNNGIGFYAYLTRSFIAYKDERFRLFYLGLWWFFYWSVRRLILSFMKPGSFPADLISAELFGSIIGPWRYFKSRKIAGKLSRLYNSPLEKYPFKPVRSFYKNYSAKKRSLLKTIDLYDSGYYKNSFEEYFNSRIIFYLNEKYACKKEIKNNYAPISDARLKEEIFSSISPSEFGLTGKLNEHNFKEIILTSAAPLPNSSNPKRLNKTSKISIIIPTLDRPKDLTSCLVSLKNMNTDRDIEIVVVDNNPSSQLTPPVVNEFKNVKLVREEKKGLSSARNRGLIECTGEIAVCIDDDVIVSPSWLENLLEPFNDDKVAGVTGNVFSLDLETKAERLFELYGGLGRGDTAKEYGREWFNKNRIYALRTWELGATANAAFRTSIFKDEKIGLLNEALGAGTPSGCSEDTYLFYKILKAGYSIYYQPSAYVFHKHRKEIGEFYKQIFNYSKGHVAYNLLTFFNDKDKRGLVRIFYELPLSNILKIKRRLLRQANYPIILTAIEIFGNILGPFALVRSIWRLRNNKGMSKYGSRSNRSPKILYKTS